MDKKQITIVTHSSKFHPDDVFGVATLLLVFEKDFDVRVLRSRDSDTIAQADYVLDVGGIYNPETNRFDHHQEGGAGIRSNGVPYAAFGLAWKHYGDRLCKNKEIFDKVDQILIQSIDANDNGIEFVESKIPGLYPAGIRSLFYIFRPTWKEEEDLDEIFMRLVSYAKVILQRLIICTTDEAEAESLVIEAYKKTADKRVVVLDERYPWEETLEKFPEPLFVVYPKRIDNTWSLKSIRNDIYSYNSRKLLPENWAGKFGEELEKITGVKDAVFCHNGRFIAVAKTKEAILKLADIALN